MKEVIPNVPKSLLPSDFTREVPTRALQWLLQFGLPYQYWQPSIGYSEAHERLVFTVGEPIQFSIGRYVGSDEKQRKWYVWGDCHKHCEVLGDRMARMVVLVEDLISAHKIASAGFISIPLFGTKVHNPHLYYLINSDLPVALWLDKDQENSVKRQAMKLESLINRPVKVITTEKDPKWLNSQSIQTLIS